MEWVVLLPCHIPILPTGEVLQVTVEPPSTVQKLGGTVLLGCVVEPPSMNITWRLNGKELNGSDDTLGILITHETLVITALSNHTVGRYQCVARMSAGAVASVPAMVTLASEYCLISPLLVQALSPSFYHSHSELLFYNERVLRAGDCTGIKTFTLLVPIPGSNPFHHMTPEHHWK